MAEKQVATIEFEPLVAGIEKLTVEVVKRIDALREQATEGNGMSIVKMFELQLKTSEFENFVSSSTNIVSAIFAAASAMARNLKQ
jgi:hypothetical protein